MLFSFQPGGARTKYLCVYWEGSEEGGSWSTEGCTHVSSNDSYTTCKCFHLSSFAVLMALVPKVPRFMVPSCKSECVQEAGTSSAPCLIKTLKMWGQAEVTYLRGSSRKYQQETEEVKWEKGQKPRREHYQATVDNWSLCPPGGLWRSV